METLRKTGAPLRLMLMLWIRALPLQTGSEPTVSREVPVTPRVQGGVGKDPLVIGPMLIGGRKTSVKGNQGAS